MALGRPRSGQDLEFVGHRQNWVRTGPVCTMRTVSWARCLPGGPDVAPADAFVVIADGRCPFTIDGRPEFADLRHTSPATDTRPEPCRRPRPRGVPAAAPGPGLRRPQPLWPASSSKQIHAPLAAASLVPSATSGPATRRSSPHRARRLGAPGPAGCPMRCSRYEVPRSMYRTRNSRPINAAIRSRVHR